MQDWRFFVKSEQSYKFFRFSTKCSFLHSISEVARTLNKKTRKNFITAHQNNLFHFVENNLTIILVQEWRFFVKSEQSYKFFRFSTKCGFLNSISGVSACALNKKKT